MTFDDFCEDFPGFPADFCLFPLTCEILVDNVVFFELVI